MPASAKNPSASSAAARPAAAGRHATAPEDRIPLRKRIAYGFGSFSDHIGTDSLVSNANPIFNVALHVDPRLLGAAMGIMRLWDAVTDPVVGAISDNVRTRWGRRRPFMLLGALGAGLCFPLIWMAPDGSSQQAIFIWFTLFSILFFTCQTFFTIPWTALGYELTPDYNERTRLMEQRAYIGTAVGLVVPWTYAFTQLPVWGGNTLVGARWMGVIVGVIIILTGLIPVLALKERFFAKAKNQPKLGIFKAIGMTLRNRPFLMMVAITFFTVVGSRTVSHLGFYVGLYYLFDGDTVKQGVFTGIWGNVALVAGVLSVFVLNRVSHRIGKRHTLAVCLGLLIFASVAQWLLYTPEYPYLSLLVIVFVQPANSGFWLLISSIKADICDDDELRTGLRREGSIGAVSAWISKMSTSATAVLAGVVLAATGYQPADAANQAPGVIDNIRWCFYFIPSVTAIPALILLYFFPISEARSREIRRLLEERRGRI